jgi:exonuclease III
MNVHAPTEDKIDDIKDRFYEELEQISDKFPRYHMKILLGDFNASVGREDIFRPTVGNECLHKISNDNGVGKFIFVKFCGFRFTHKRANTSELRTFAKLLGVH